MSKEMVDLDSLRKNKLASHLRGVLHEINNALGVVMINLSFIEDEMESLRKHLPVELYTVLKEACDDIETAAKRINGYSRAMTYLANPLFLQQKQEFEVGQLIDMIIELLHNFLKRRVTIKIHKPEVEEFIAEMPPGILVLTFIEMMELLVDEKDTGKIVDITLDSVPVNGKEFIRLTILKSELDEVPETTISTIIEPYGGQLEPIETGYGKGYRILVPASHNY